MEICGQDCYRYNCIPFIFSNEHYYNAISLHVINLQLYDRYVVLDLSQEDKTIMLKHYIKAAHDGIKFSWLCIGDIKAFVEKDYKAAMLCYKLAYKHKVPYAPYKIACMYEMLGDFKKALEFHEIGIFNQVIQSYVSKASMLIYGYNDRKIVFGKDIKRALGLIKQAQMMCEHVNSLDEDSEELTQIGIVNGAGSIVEQSELILRWCSELLFVLNDFNPGVTNNTVKANFMSALYTVRHENSYAKFIKYLQKLKLCNHPKIKVLVEKGLEKFPDKSEEIKNI